MFCVCCGGDVAGGACCSRVGPNHSLLSRTRACAPARSAHEPGGRLAFEPGIGIKRGIACFHGRLPPRSRQRVRDNLIYVIMQCLLDVLSKKTKSYVANDCYVANY